MYISGAKITFATSVILTVALIWFLSGNVGLRLVMTQADKMGLQSGVYYLYGVGAIKGKGLRGDNIAEYMRGRILGALSKLPFAENYGKGTGRRGGALAKRKRRNPSTVI